MTEHGYELIYKYLKPYKKNLRAVIIFALVANVFLLMIPFVVKQLIEQYSILVFQQATVFLILLALFLLVGISFMQLLQMNLVERLQRRIFLDGFERVLAKVKATNSGRLNVKNFNYVFETINLQKSLAPLITEGITLAIQAAFVFILISVYHPSFLVLSVIMIGSLYYTIIVLGSKGERLSVAESDSKYQAISTLETLATKNSEEPVQESDVEKCLLNYYRKREDRYRLYFRQSCLLLIIKVIAAILLLSLGGILVVTNAMTIGQFVASELIVINLLISLFKVSNILDYWYTSVVAVQKLRDNFPEVTVAP